MIVMVTKCVEMMKRKCAQYWPEKVGTVVNHRNISVEVLKIDTASGFEQRTIKVAMKVPYLKITSYILCLHIVCTYNYIISYLLFRLLVANVFTKALAKKIVAVFVYLLKLLMLYAETCFFL